MDSIAVIKALWEDNCSVGMTSEVFDLFESAIREGNLTWLALLNNLYTEDQHKVLMIRNSQNQGLFHLLSITGGYGENTRVQIAELLFSRLPLENYNAHQRCPEALKSKDSQGRSPLHYAAKFRRTGILEWFVEKRFLQNIFEIDDDEKSPFQYLVTSRREDMVLIVKLIWENVNHTYKFKGNPPLHLAAESSSIEMLKLLVEFCEFDPDRYDINGGTPVHSVIRYGDESPHGLANTISRLTYLLEKTSAERHLTVAKDTPIHIAAMFGKAKILEFLFSVCIDCDTGSLTIRKTGRSSSIYGYLDNKSNQKAHPLVTSSLNVYGQTCLHVVPNQTVNQGSVDCIKHILNHPDLTYPRELQRFCLQKDHTRNAQTVFHIAAEFETVEICQEILKFLRYDAKAEWLQEEILLPIYQKIPDALVPVFEKCVKPKNDFTRREEQMTVEFAPIIGYRRHLGNGRPTTTLVPETHFLHLVNLLPFKVKSKVYACPVIEKFIEEKFKVLKRFIIGGFIFQIVYICLFIFLAYIVEECDTMKQNATNTNSTNGSQILTQSECDPLEFTRVSGTVCILTIICATLFLSKEFYQYSRSKRHFSKPTNVFQLVFSVLSLFCTITFFVIDTKYVLPYTLFRVLTAGVVLLGGALGVHEFKKINWYPSFLRIFIQVAKRSAVLLTYYTLPIVAFTVVFKILSPQNVDFTFFHGVVKVLAMMVGEYEFEANFKLTSETKLYDPFLANSKLIAFALFIFIAAIVGLNLLIGLAVEDIQAFKTDAQLEVLSCQVDELYLMEQFLLSLKPILPRKIYYWMLDQINFVVNTKRAQPDGFYKTEFDFRITHKK